MSGIVKLLDWLRQKNRTLLELHLGIVFLGILCQLVGAFVVQNQLRYAGGLWFGILMAVISALHLYRTLDTALDYDERTASKLIFRGYLIRYLAIAVIFFIVAVTDVWNIIIVFMAYMSLKVAALIQPFTHKLCNKLFHETDPVAEALPEDVEQILKE